MKLHKVKHVKPKWEKFYWLVITDAYVKKAVLEICFKKKTKESLVGTVKNICT